MVAGWMPRSKAERLQAEREIGETNPEPTSNVEVCVVVVRSRDGQIGAAKASPAQKAAMYTTTGLRLTYYTDTGDLNIQSCRDFVYSAACQPGPRSRVRVGVGTRGLDGTGTVICL